ncbi:hypothetical protein M378DRAFT_47309, partial [Amanita muscaria Koide BX008]
PYYGPDEDSQTIFLERTFLASTVVQGIGVGAQLVLYIMCVRYLWRERERRGRVMLFLFGYVTLLLIFSALWTAISTWTTEDIYINNRNYPGGPWIYFVTTQDLPENIMYLIVLFALTFLSDLLVLWRCWVIWISSSSSFLVYVVVMFPFLILLASFALGLAWSLVSSLSDFPPYSKIPLALGTSYYVTSLTVNIVITILIILRLALHRRAILQALSPDYAKQYLSLAAIIVESAALYSVFALAFIISYAFGNPINQIILPLASSSQQIAGYLIILRVAQGRAWSASVLEVTTETT